MATTLEHAGFHKVTSQYPEEHELMAPEHHALTRQKASQWLTRAQKELHDAIFAKDGSDASLDRYASARADLDSAEAWALRVAGARRQQRD